MGGCGERDLDNSLIKTHAPCRKLVNMGRRDTLGAVTGEMVCPQRIQRDQEDIGISRLAFPHLRCLDAVRAARTAGQKYSEAEHPDHSAPSEG
jgi:hypothetical protein